MRIESYRAAVEEDGFAVVPECLTADDVGALQAALRQALNEIREDESAAVRDRGGVFAIRNLLDVVPATRGLARHAGVRRLVEPVLGPQAALVRGTLFDKTDTANWGLFWHQDLSIAVRSAERIPGWGPWTRKAGVACVQPPVEILQQMLAVRLHLDDCTEAHGPLTVLPGSHRAARLSAAATQQWTTGRAAVSCVVPAGGAVVMRPLLLHASSRKTAVGHRRVLHLEFAGIDLPAPLAWRWHETPAPVR